MTVLVAVDGSPESARALDFAAGLARSGGAGLLVVNVAEDMCPVGLTELDTGVLRDLAMKEADAVIAAAQAQLASRGVSARVVVEQGAPAEVICSVASREGATHVVVGSHGKHGARKLALGSVSGRVAEWAPCTVTIVK